MSSLRVLGVDLSITSCGVALVEGWADRTGMKLHFATTLHMKSGKPRVERRAIVRDAIAGIQSAFKFDALVMEHVMLFFGGKGGKNMGGKAIEGITSLAATIEDWCYLTRIPVAAIAPATWRKAVLRNGRAQKSDAVAYVERCFKRTLPYDSAEATCQAVYGCIPGVLQHDIS